MKLWSQRFSIANGWHWKLERQIKPEETEQWLKVFRFDEPGILFVASEKKPN